MRNYYNDVILVLRENGINQIGQVGKEILAHMIVEKIYTPNATYEQICEAVKRKKIARYMDIVPKEDLISNSDKLSNEECSVLYIIEGVETHEYGDDGAKVIETFIEKMYAKVLKRLEYEKILIKVQSLGLKTNEIGVRLMISIAYQRRICPTLSEKEVYCKVMDEYRPTYITNKLKNAKNTMAELRNGANLGLPTQNDIIKEGIDEMILQVAKSSTVFSQSSNVKDIINMILKS